MMVTYVYLFRCLGILFVFHHFKFAIANNYNLKAVNVIFRHGDRLPESDALYPNDPYYNRDYYPIEIGGLTNNGKLREYNLGKLLRKRYDKFLGDYYFPSELYARSTDYDRARMSLLLVLAALYPPTNVQHWKEDLNWQPIPMRDAPLDNDPILYPFACPTFKAEKERIEGSEEYKTEFEQFKTAMPQLSKYTGLNITSTSTIYAIYCTLISEMAMNLTLPEWTKPYFPEGFIKDAAEFEIKGFFWNTLLLRLSAGMTYRRILDDMTAIAKGKKAPKISLYSGHDINVASHLRSLTWRVEIPPYGSAIIYELWKEKSNYFIKALYYRGVPSEFEILTIDECDIYCPLDKFKMLLNDRIAVNPKRECFDQSHIKKIRNSIYMNPV